MKIAVIGAGLTGLTAAHYLNDIAELTVFDKSRGVGGRMSTRRAGSFQFDHGAQYFVAKTKEFQSFLQKPLKDGAVSKWDAHFAEIDGETRKIINSRNWDSSFQHYVGSPGMNGLAKSIASNLFVCNNTFVKSIERTGSEKQSLWQLKSDQNKILGEFDWVITTGPVQQSRDLLPSFFQYESDLASIEMFPCFTVMLGFDDNVQLPFQAALVRNSKISWIALDSHKAHRPSNCSIVIQSSNEWADVQVDADKQDIQVQMIEEAEKILDVKLQHASHKDIHRWLYANTKKTRSNVGDVYLDTKNQLGAAGDWCGNARVESAFLHGKKIADQIKACVLHSD